MLISLATGSKETLTPWVNTKTVNMKREISLPVKSNLRTRKEFLQKRNQTHMSDFSGHKKTFPNFFIYLSLHFAS
jgi:hypothetical protein